MCKMKEMRDESVQVVKQRMSHLAPLTSHLIPYTSHITPHISHLTPRTSHLTPHTLHLTPRTLHLTPHTQHLTPHTSNKFQTPHTSQIMKECSVACARAYCTRADIQPTAAEHVCPPPATTAFLQPPFCINSLTCGVYDRSAA
jgi:hypothetical protein